MKKRILAVLLALVLIISAGTAPAKTQAAEVTADNLAGVLETVKKSLGIGNDYTNFDYSSWDSHEGTVWSFNWYSEDYSQSAYVTCDGDGHVMSYSVYDGTDRSGCPVYTRDEILEDAQKYLEKIFPEAKGHVRYESSYYQSYESCYCYRFVRVENGIDMPDNAIRICVSSRDRSLRSVDADWLYKVKIPSAAQIIGKDKAAEKIGKKLTMELKYLLSYGEDEKQEAHLAYVPSKSYLAVDAISGKVYTTKQSYSSASEQSAIADEEAPMADKADYNGLSDAEIKRVDELADVISEAQAIAAVKNNKYLLIDSSINRTTASLGVVGNSYVWNVNMQDNRPVDWESGDYYRAYVYASVNALTGELISFNSSVKTVYELTPEELESYRVNFTKAQCRNRAAEFLKSACADKFASSKLSSTVKTHIISINYETDEREYAGYQFYYERCHSDVPVDGNGIDVSIDAVTGKVMRFYTNWADGIEFAEPDKAIGADKAEKLYLALDGFALSYEVISDYNTDTGVSSAKVRLVYSTEIYPEFIDAFTGKQIYYDGSEYSRTAEAYEYTDIEGNKYERAIRLLASMDIGPVTEKYEPDKAITKDEFNELLAAVNGYYYARESSVSGSGKLTRQAAAKAAVEYLGYGKLAGMDIYKTGYSDEAKIGKDYIGSVALAKGLGIMGAVSGRKFKPTAAVTRGEAAQIVLDVITAGR